ncbi:hypothetical protein PRMUPPPA20_20770 [Xylanibacter ruminicola]|uniref:Acyltransferase 3 domain-containing protein n=1 Tax=Xylanibacter ruminicola TaxID=839 RepID=A0AA37I4P6_XYLRU|nr:acyltransferase [Xylanibacter ruminicola]GJG33968.1 hypothetical protein PRMUPPPA20_20770 [Xylanibacter ruminicola]
MKERVLSLDLIKIFAMIGVVSLHTTLGLESYDNIFSRYLYSLGGWAIPLFFTTSGFLQIGRTIDFKYILKKTLRIFRIIVFVAIIYWLKDGGDAVSLVKDYIFLSLFQKGPVGHFWFFGAIIICYAATPFFNNIMKKPWGTELCLIILFLLMSFAFVANVKDNFESNVIQTFRLWNWLFYYCLGGYIRQNSEQIKAFFKTDYKWKTISRPILFILLGGGHFIRYSFRI